MFLEKLIEENTPLIKESLNLLKKGEILPDTYVIDLDMIIRNGKIMISEASKYGIELYFMMKQFGTNPIIAKELLKIGFKKAVVVDFKEAITMMKNNIPIGNVGHLVQIPDKLLEEIISYGAEIITVYSLDKIKLINEISKKQNKVQPIMLRIVDEDSSIYDGQESGFYPREIDELALEVKKLSNVKLEGLTSFPCFLYDKEENKVLGTKNLKTLHDVKARLEEKGFQIKQMNMPSNTSTEIIKHIKENNGTHGEPGHGLSATTPYHKDNTAAEKIAYLYISEVSHNFLGKGYFYGGGNYRRSNLKNALVGERFENLRKDIVINPNPDSIDYYFGLLNEASVGEAVIMCSRTQMFVLRSDIAIVKGISTNNPELVGIFNQRGEKVK